MHILPHAAAGGATLAAMELAQHLDPNRYEVSMAVGPESGGEHSILPEMRECGLDFCVIPHMRRLPDLRCDARALVELGRLFHERRPHIVHTHGSKSKLLVAVAAEVGHVPVRIAHVWGWEWMPAQGAVQRCACRWAARLSAQGYDALIACSEAMREQGLAHGVGRAAQYEVALPSIDHDRFNPRGRDLARREVRAEFGLPPDAPVVVSVMRLAAQKAPDVLLRAAALLTRDVPALRWLIVGGGPLEDEVRGIISELGLHDRVTLAGPRRDVPRLLKAGDIFALASGWEPFGIVYLEAAATGLPIVGTRVDGAVEAVQHGETGLLVEPRNPAALAHAVARIATDPELAQGLGDAGIRHARRFERARFVDPIASLYERLLADRMSGWQSLR